MGNWWKSTATTMEMIKWEHSIFALPFALVGAMLASGGMPPVRVLLWIIVCMVSARSAAMAFNRWADADLDRANPRTATRAIPAGVLSREFVGGFTVVAALVFLGASAMLNRMSLMLAPVALAVIFAYSYMKRITSWSHLVLGLALGIAPSAAWIAVRGALDARILVLTGAVLLWVSGFDILYACQDLDHDRSVGLHSIPQAFGLQTAFWLARAAHATMIVMLIWLTKLFTLGVFAWAGVALVAMLLGFEHAIVSPKDLKRLNAAFFTLNGVISLLFFFFVGADVLTHK